MFLRFVATHGQEAATAPLGLFTALEQLETDERLEPHEEAWANELCDWFGNHLPVPPFAEILSLWSDDAICWFHSDGGEPLRRMWELATFLREKGRPIAFLRTTEPGTIVYSDRYQIVAVPPNRRRRRQRQVWARCFS